MRMANTANHYTPFLQQNQVFPIGKHRKISRNICRPLRITVEKKEKHHPFGWCFLLAEDEGFGCVFATGENNCVVLLRCPTSASGNKVPWHLSTAATRSGRSSRHRRRSHRSPVAFIYLSPFLQRTQRLPLSGVSEAQSAVVNDSPVDCQSRRPGSPQRAVSEAD